ncbi:MAG TPA: FKBP-type peptidyl-prolyl cis-trans isomerase [Usitatibacter sp.]|nr:FKBP-type peptidyl-prolyl cis-trans isomerase [Usitatibacter sp.]
MKNSLTLALVAAFAFGCAGTGQGGDAAAGSSAAGKTAAATSTTTTAAAESKATPKAGDCQPPPKDLVVKDLQEGTGKVVQFRSAVLVGYTGWTYDGCKPDFKGAEFDSSKNRPTPFGLVVGAGRVIKGWDEGLIGMKEKGKRLLVIPPDKAYGARSPTPLIPPNSTLVFEIELVQIITQPGEPAK